MEQWTTTTDTALAAAFGTLGMPLRVMREIIAGKTPETVRFGIGLVNQEGTVKTKRLQSDHRSGKLAATVPDHPLLVILAAIANREALLDCANRGSRIVLARDPRSVIHRYARGDSGLPGVPAGSAIIRTGDLKLVAALATVGCPLLAIAGERHQRVFSVAAVGPEIPSFGRVEAPALMAAWRADPASVPWEHPFAQAMRGLHNRERLLDCVNRSAIKVTIVHPDGGRYGIVTADSKGNLPGKAMDGVSGFFDR